MTQEEKAKAYDKAYEKVAVRFGSNVADEIFPELKESEDEKAIRDIKVVLESSATKFFKEEGKMPVWYDRAIAWLEKQGEHVKFLNSIQVGDKVTRNEDGVLVNLSQLKRVAKPAENKGEHDMGISEATKQELEDKLHEALEKETPESFNEFLDEQNPADKVEPSIFKDRLLELFQIFRWRCKDHIMTNGEILEYVNAHIQELIGTMQKPADTEKGTKGNDMEIPNSAWSEEDEKILGKCIDAASGYYSPEDKQSMKNWLKSLKDRVQPKQEWSDYDECMLTNLIDDPNCSIDSEYVHWFKSLKDRYAWKPSDEQMEELHNVFNDTSAGWDDNVIESLYNDLKKLIGE